MSRRAPIPDLYHQLGDVYILHLDPPYKHAAHYSGFSPENSEGVQGRVAEHAAGGPAAARLMQVQHEAGGTFRVGRVWRGVTREREVRVKESSAAKYCLICRGKPEIDLDLPTVRSGSRWSSSSLVAGQVAGKPCRRVARRSLNRRRYSGTVLGNCEPGS